MVATDRHTDRHTDRQTHRRHAKNNFFGFSGPQNVNIHQNLEVDFLGKCNTFSILRIAEKVKKIEGMGERERQRQRQRQTNDQYSIAIILFI